LAGYITKSIRQIFEISQKESVTLTNAAFMLALRQLTKSKEFKA
jgi:hypothetical protein